MLNKNYTRRIAALFICFTLFFSLFAPSNVGFALNANKRTELDLGKTTTPKYNLKIYEFIEDDKGISMGKEITQVYPGDKVVVTISLDNLSPNSGFASFEHILHYDKGVVDYLGIPGAGVMEDSVGGFYLDLDEQTKDYFNVGFPKTGLNTKFLTFKEENSYEKLLIEYPAYVDHGTIKHPNIRAIYSSGRYEVDPAVYDKSRLLFLQQNISDQNILSSYVFQIKETPQNTPGESIFTIDPSSLLLSYYNSEDLVDTTVLYETAGPDNIFDVVEKPGPVDPEIVVPSPENITDTIDQTNRTRTVTVGNVKGEPSVPEGTVIKVYDPKGDLLGEKTANKDGSVTVDIVRGNDEKNAVINLGGEYRVTAQAKDDLKESIAIPHVVKAIDNKIIADVIMEDRELPPGSNLGTLPTTAKDIPVFADPKTGFEDKEYKLDTIGLGSWKFVDPSADSNVLGTYEVEADFILPLGVVNPDNKFKAKSKVIIKETILSKISLGKGNALAPDIESGKDKETNIYTYYNNMFRDTFLAINDKGIDVTKDVERTISKKGSNNSVSLPKFVNNESINLNIIIDNPTGFFQQDLVIKYTLKGKNIDPETGEIEILAEDERTVKVIHKLGDLDRNGVIDSKDSKIINDYVLGFGTDIKPLFTPEIIKSLIDTNRDTKVDLGDAHEIIAHMRKLSKIKQYYTFVADDYL
ncbi:MAG: hypothetical protein KFW09_01400 [Oscillospiraceae bacterium]|nr:hypothetical protein [Oscillospiraceae bacterium]